MAENIWKSQAASHGGQKERRKERILSPVRASFCQPDPARVIWKEEGTSVEKENPPGWPVGKTIVHFHD